MNDEARDLVPHSAGNLARQEDAPHNMLEIVMRAAQDPSIDPGRLEKFLQIGRELEADKAKREWAQAFRAAKDEIDGIQITKKGVITYKDGSTIKFTRYDDLAAVVKPILRKHQLTASYSYQVEQTPPKTVCVLTLLHAGGHAQAFHSAPLPMIDSGGGKSDIQGVGSVMTYGRRYAIQAAFDIVAEGEDNDGSGQRLAEPITSEELQTVIDIVTACNDKQPAFRGLFAKWLYSQFKIQDPKDLLQGNQLKSVRAKLTEKQKELGL